MSTRYTADGKRRSSQTHAQRGWTCPCGRRVFGNGGKSSHQRACDVYAAKALETAERMLDWWNDPVNEVSGTIYGADRRAQYTAERDKLRERLGVACRSCVTTDAGLVCQADLGGQCTRGER